VLPARRRNPLWLRVRAVYAKRQGVLFLAFVVSGCQPKPVIRDDANAPIARKDVKEPMVATDPKEPTGKTDSTEP
jgi:hypothetical protein